MHSPKGSFTIIKHRTKHAAFENWLNQETSVMTPTQPLKFSIITPSFRNSAWLKLCIASVADQQGVELEHLVQDSCSDDGTQD